MSVSNKSKYAASFSNKNSLINNLMKLPNICRFEIGVVNSIYTDNEDPFGDNRDSFGKVCINVNVLNTKNFNNQNVTETTIPIPYLRRYIHGCDEYLNMKESSSSENKDKKKKGSGSHRLPTPGTRVLIAYIGHDYNCPVILGCLPDNLHSFVQNTFKDIKPEDLVVNSKKMAVAILNGNKKGNAKEKDDKVLIYKNLADSNSGSDAGGSDDAAGGNTSDSGGGASGDDNKTIKPFVKVNFTEESKGKGSALDISVNTINIVAKSIIIESGFGNRK